ncbi:MAG: hypothetical protein ACYDCK_01440 [Thermoplasmatota archaeon]
MAKLYARIPARYVAFHSEAGGELAGGSVGEVSQREIDLYGLEVVAKPGKTAPTPPSAPTPAASVTASASVDAKSS